MEKVSITLTEAHKTLAREAIDAGEYASLSEVLRSAMREWERRREERNAAIESLKRDLTEAEDAIAAGDVYPFDPQEIKAAARQRWQSR